MTQSTPTRTSTLENILTTAPPNDEGTTSSERCPHCGTEMEHQGKSPFPNAVEFRCPMCSVRKIIYGADFARPLGDEGPRNGPSEPEMDVLGHVADSLGGR